MLTHCHSPPKCLCRAQVSVFEMPAAVPFKGAVCATLYKPAVQGADVITYRSHDSVFRMLFLVAKAQINVLCLHRMCCSNSIQPGNHTEGEAAATP